MEWEDLYSHPSELIRERTSFRCQKLAEMKLCSAEGRLTDEIQKDVMWAGELYSRNKSILGADESNPTPSIRIRRDCRTLPNSALPLVSNPSNIPPNPTHPTTKLLTSCAAMFLQKGPENYFRNHRHWTSETCYETKNTQSGLSEFRVAGSLTKWQKVGYTSHTVVFWIWALRRYHPTNIKHNVMCIFDRILSVSQGKVMRV